MTSQRDRALKLIEKEDQQAARRQEQCDQEAHESRIKLAIQRVKEQDRRAERERQRADALDRAENMEPEIIQKHRGGRRRDGSVRVCRQRVGEPARAVSRSAENGGGTRTRTAP